MIDNKPPRTPENQLKLEDLSLEELKELLEHKKQQHIHISGSKKLLFCLSLFLLVFFVVEGISTYRRWKKERKRTKEGAHKVNTKDETHYGLKPNSEGTLSGAKFHINSRGFRNPEFNKEKESLRAVCVGDSLTFGWGATDEETYPFFLNQEIKGIEVINGGVIGYNTKNLIRRVEEDILPLKPDLLICLIGWNNLREYVYGNLRPMPRKEHRVWDHIATSYLLKENMKKLDRSFKITYRKAVKQTLNSKNEEKKWPFFKEFRSDLIHLKSICDKAKLPVVFLSIPHFFSEELSEKDQFELLNITLGVDLSYKGWANTIAQMNQIIIEVVGKKQFIDISGVVHESADFSDFCHPTPKANQKMAKALASEIEKRIKKQ